MDTGILTAIAFYSEKWLNCLNVKSISSGIRLTTSIKPLTRPFSVFHPKKRYANIYSID